MQTILAFHTPQTVDACPLEGKMHLRFKAEKGVLSKAVLVYNCNKNFWHIRRLEAEMERSFEDSRWDYFSVSVPLTDTRFAYIFKLIGKDGAISYLSEEGVTEEYDHSLGYFSFFQYCSQFDCDAMTVPEWVKSAVCYQIFPERFFMGDQKKERSYINAEWGQLPTPKSFYGGDLVGIRQKLPYLQELGISLLYLTPVFCSPSNHKYDITNYEQVDPAFGGNEALKELIAGAHSCGIKVMLDGVFNHCSWEHPFFLDAQRRGKKSPYYDWFFWQEDGAYLTFGSVKTMPKLNTGNPAVIRYFSDVAVMWMEKYGADGWRLDVSDEISHRFLRGFRDAVLKQNPDAIIIGEDWHRPVRYLNGDEYDGTMNYGFTKACLDLMAFGTIDASEFCNRLVKLYHTYSLAATAKMLNLLGSHDTDRFLTRVCGDTQKLRAAMALMFFYPGMPCIYYGDEIDTEGGYDPDCRRCFDWKKDNWDTETRNLICRLAKLKKEPALSTGTFRIREEKGIVTLERAAQSQRLLLRLNATDHVNQGLQAYEFTIITK